MSHMLTARLPARRKQGIRAHVLGKRTEAHTTTTQSAETEQWRPNAKNDDTPKNPDTEPVMLETFEKKLAA